MLRLYCHPPNVDDLVLKQFRNNDWNEGDDHDANEFLKIEREIFITQYPMYAKLLENEGDEEDNNIGHSRKEQQKEDDRSIDTDINHDSDNMNDYDDDDSDAGKKPAAKEKCTV